MPSSGTVMTYSSRVREWGHAGKGKGCNKGQGRGAAASSRRAQAWECEVTWLRDGVSGDGDLPTVQVLDGLGEAQQRLLQAAVGEVGGESHTTKRK